MTFCLNIVKSLAYTLWILIDILIVWRVGMEFQHLILKVVDWVLPILQELWVVDVQELGRIGAVHTRLCVYWAKFTVSSLLIPAATSVEDWCDLLSVGKASVVLLVREPVVIMIWMVRWKFNVLRFEADFFFCTPLRRVERLMSLPEFLACWVHGHFHLFSLLHHLDPSNISWIIYIEFLMSWKDAYSCFLFYIFFFRMVRAIFFDNRMPIMIAEARLLINMLHLCKRLLRLHFSLSQ